MNYRELIKQLTPVYGSGEARAVVNLVMEERFGLSQTDLLLGKDTTLSSDALKDFEKIAARLINGEPVQYVLGQASFCGHLFHVTPSVLIPRPETEELVQLVIDRFRLVNNSGSLQSSISNFAPPVNLLDLCTGSGCIAISLALSLPGGRAVGVDISNAALDVARLNALKLGAPNVSFSRADVLDAGYDPGQLFDIIVSNPPYVRQSEAATMEPHVLEHEPALALFVPDDDPLRFYKAIAGIALRNLKPQGSIFLEASCFSAHEVAELFMPMEFKNVEVLPDQFGKERFVIAQKVNFN